MHVDPSATDAVINILPNDFTTEVFQKQFLPKEKSDSQDYKSGQEKLAYTRMFFGEGKSHLHTNF